MVPEWLNLGINGINTEITRLVGPLEIPYSGGYHSMLTILKHHIPSVNLGMDQPLFSASGEKPPTSSRQVHCKGMYWGVLAHSSSFGKVGASGWYTIDISLSTKR